MENNKELHQKMFKNLETFVGVEWAKSRREAYAELLKMKKRQLLLTEEQVFKEAMEQAKKIRKQRLENQ